MDVRIKRKIFTFSSPLMEKNTEQEFYNLKIIKIHHLKIKLRNITDILVKILLLNWRNRFFFPLIKDKRRTYFFVSKIPTRNQIWLSHFISSKNLQIFGEYDTLPEALIIRYQIKNKTLIMKFVK